MAASAPMPSIPPPPRLYRLGVIPGGRPAGLCEHLRLAETVMLHGVHRGELLGAGDRPCLCGCPGGAVKFRLGFATGRYEPRGPPRRSLRPSSWIVLGVQGIALWGTAGAVVDTRQAKRLPPSSPPTASWASSWAGLVTRPLARASARPMRGIVVIASAVLDDKALGRWIGQARSHVAACRRSSPSSPCSRSP
jgi:hypothetical protein